MTDQRTPQEIRDEREEKVLDESLKYVRRMILAHRHQVDELENITFLQGARVGGVEPNRILYILDAVGTVANLKALAHSRDMLSHWRLAENDLLDILSVPTQKDQEARP